MEATPDARPRKEKPVSDTDSPIVRALHEALDSILKSGEATTVSFNPDSRFQRDIAGFIARVGEALGRRIDWDDEMLTIYAQEDA